MAHQSTTDENKVSLHFAARKQEARRIDSENLNFARRILAQKPLIETKDSMDRSYEKQKQIVKNLSKNSKLSIGHIVSQAEFNYSYVRPTMKTQERLPALKVGGARINDSSQMSRKRSPSSQFDLSQGSKSVINKGLVEGTKTSQNRLRMRSLMRGNARNIGRNQQGAVLKTAGVL